MECILVLRFQHSVDARRVYLCIWIEVSDELVGVIGSYIVIFWLPTEGGVDEKEKHTLYLDLVSAALD